MPETNEPIRAEVAVLGAGPGGYTAAFRAADLGKKVVLIERYPILGGVCLNVGCIPSKALLHMAEVIVEAQKMSEHGVEFGAPKLDLAKIRAQKEDAVATLTKGVAAMAKARKVKVVTGVGKFTGPNEIRVETPEGPRIVAFEHAIIAAGSQATKIPGIPYDDPRVMDSTDALTVPDVPKRMLIIGGGIIGLEMATVYHAFGAKITVVELMDQLIPGCDPDLVRWLHKAVRARYENIFLQTKVAGVDAKPDGLHVRFEGEKAPADDVFDRVLVAVGRRPNGKLLDAEKAGVTVTEQGFIPVDGRLRTNVPHIFAIGDVACPPMLAHKAMHEAKVAAEVIAGHKVAFDPRSIPSVAYTDPEVAWTGLTETQAKKDGITVKKTNVNWAVNGRSLGMGNKDGATKLLFDPETNRLLGAGMVGPRAGELIAEATLAIEMGADATDLALTIHPHPTLTETIGIAAEIADGSATDVLLPKK